MSKTFRTRVEAEAWAIGTERAQRAGPKKALAIQTENASQRLSLAMTLREALARYQLEVTPLKKGAKQEAQRLLQWQGQPVAVKAIGEVSTADIVAWRNREAAIPAPGGKPRAPSTIANKLNLLSAVFEHARTEWDMQGLQNPCRSVKRPRARAGREVRFTTRHEAALFDTLRSRNQTWLWYAARLAVLTAMRQGELLALEWSDWDGRVVRLSDTKNGTAREVPLSTQAITTLEGWERASGRPNSRIFPVSACALQNAFREAVKQARKQHGIPHTTFHDLRHIAATQLSKKLSNVLELSAVTGHKSLSVLKRYYNPHAEDLAAKLG